MTSVTRSDAQANRARLVEAARSLISERGREAEMKDIAERAGVGIGTIYRNFATKQDLVQAIMDACIAEAVLDVRAVIEDPDPRERIRWLIAVAWKHAELNGTLFDAIGKPAHEHSAPQEMFTLIAGALGDGQAAGVVRPGIPPDFLARFLFAQFGAYVEMRLDYPFEVLAKNLTDLVLGALLVPENPDRQT